MILIFLPFALNIGYLVACKGIKKMTLNLEQVLLMRNDTSGMYFDFIEYFILAVVGKIYYKENRCENLLSDFTTVSDEALAILIIENNFDTWWDMAKRNITKDSGVGRKYTNGGTSAGTKASSRRYQGWSADGIKRFNEIFDLVKLNRSLLVAKSFEESFKSFCENGGVTGKKPKQCEVLHPTIEICHKLWSDSDNDDTGDQEVHTPKKQKIYNSVIYPIELCSRNASDDVKNEEEEDKDEAPLPEIDQS